MDFSPDDLTMQIAEALERYKKTFYESLATICNNVRIAAIATSLANAEGEHLSALRRMREVQPPLNRCRQCTEEELYIAAKESVWHIVFPDTSKVRTALSSSEIRKALDLAIAMETQSAAFYTGLAGITGPNAAVLSRLAKEKNEHLSILTEQRKWFSCKLYHVFRKR